MIRCLYYHILLGIQETEIAGVAKLASTIVEFKKPIFDHKNKKTAL
jgi:hypothetical protein